MEEDGRIYKALQKAAAEKQKSPERRAPEYGPLSSAREFGSSGPESGSFRRVKGGCGEPHPSVTVVHDKWGEAASHVRAVRDKILAIDKKEPLRVITVTSGTREEGKTTFAANLSAALSEAQSGRVLVIDGDVRGLGLEVTLNVAEGEGLYQALADGVSLNGRVRETGIPGLDLMESGTPEQLDGCQAVLARRCGSLLRTLRKHYAFIVIDTPPVMASSEARIFGKYSDGTVLIARLEKTPRDVVRRALKELTEADIKVVGCVLTHRRHHVPSFIYNLVGHSPGYYYRGYKKYGRYGRDGRRTTHKKSGAPEKS